MAMTQLELEYLLHAFTYGQPLLSYVPGETSPDDDGGGGPGGAYIPDGGTPSQEVPKRVTVGDTVYDVITHEGRHYLVYTQNPRSKTVYELHIDANGDRALEMVGSDFWQTFVIAPADSPSGGIPDGGTSGGGTSGGGTSDGGTSDGGTSGGGTSDGGGASDGGVSGNVIRQGFTFVQAADGTYSMIDTTFGTIGNDLLQGVGLLLGGGGNDTIMGGASLDFLSGGDGDDLLNGGDGNDQLTGGLGNNILRGGAGADFLDGTGGWGVADYHTAQTAVTVNLDGSGNLGDEAAGDRFRNINGVQGSTHDDTLNGNVNANWILADGGNDSVDGGAGDDTVYGGEGDDQLVGGVGNDHLVGGIGNNVLEGGDGADLLDGTGGWGVADYRNSTAVTVRLDGSGSSGGQAAGDVFININGAFGSAFGDTINGNANANWIIACDGNDTVLGGAGNDSLWGAEANDSLNGGADDDMLLGGAGSDILTGGSGRDLFVFDAAIANGNVDRITDFNAADDTIQLDRGIFSAFGASVKFSFGQVASGGTAEIICNGGDLYYDADGLGGGLAVKFATVANYQSLTAADFLLI
jgi:Ca2+-binding RTX toxin-like protein